MSRESASRETRRAVESTGLTRLAFAEAAGVDPGTLGDFLDGKRWAQAPTRKKIETALGWPAGRISDLEHGVIPEQPTSGIEAAIEADPDPDLHPAAKAHLLNQLDLLRLIPPGVSIHAIEQERRRQRAAADPTHEETRDKAKARTALAKTSEAGESVRPSHRK